MKPQMKSIKNQSISGKKVLLRVDFNVPTKNGEILDDSRIKISLPTIRYLLENKAKIILVSHLGRPKGVEEPSLKLNGVAECLAGLLNLKEKIKKGKLSGLVGYQISPKIFLLENIRFYREEEENDLKFAKKLASLGDSPRGEAGIYVNEAFSCSHRAHASTEGVTHFLPSYAGFQLQEEVKFLSKLKKHPKRPFVCILGGAKVSEKIEVIENLAEKVDWFLLGGAMASTFLKAQGIDVKKSMVALDKLEPATRFWKKYAEKIILPSQVIFGERNGKRAILDIGDHDIEKFGEYVKKAKTIFWNGSLGVTEIDKYAQGSYKLAKKIIDSSAFTICAGGDTIAFLNKVNLLNRFSYVSYGGGASLEFLAGRRFKSLDRLK